MKKILWTLSFVCVLLCSCCCTENDGTKPTNDTVVVKETACCLGYEEYLIKDTLFGQGFMFYKPGRKKVGRNMRVRNYDGMPYMSSFEFYYGGHKYISFRSGGDGEIGKGTVHAPDCWCMETHRDTVVHVHHDTTYVTISQKKVDEIVRKSIEKNLEKYIQNLVEKENEKIVPIDLHEQS